MKKTLKGYLIGVLSTIMLLACVAYATSNTKTIEALYNNIKIYVDGVKIDPKDANGNTVEPFIYNGTTYLPVRAVGEAIGKTVTYDGTTQSVYLGEKPGDVQYLMEVCPPYRTTGYFKAVTVENGESFLMSGKKYTNGFTLHLGATALFNIDGKYDSLNLELGPVDSSQYRDVDIKFFVDDKLVKEYTIKPTDLSKNIEIPLNKGMQLRVEHTDTYPHGGVLTIGFGNITVE